jgi:hypothetical protein
MTASTPDELMAGFPHSSLPKVTGEPTFEDLKVIRRLLNTNAMSVASYEGGGRYGQPITTPWVEYNGARNDAEGQLRL